MSFRSRAAHILLAVILIPVATSCSLRLDILPDKATKVHIVAVALDYRNIGSTLQGTINDVTEFVTAYEYHLEQAGIPYEETLLLQYGETPDMTRDDYPAPDNLTRALEDIEAGPDDLILFVYSGHGTWDEEVGGSAIVLAQTEDEMLPLFPARRLYELLDSKGCQAIAVIDCCNSGGMNGDWYDAHALAASFTSLVDDIGYKGVGVITACAEDELSYEYITDGGQYHGAFTAELLEYMGWVHSDTVARYVDAGGTPLAVHGTLAYPRSQRMTLSDFFLGAVTDMDKSRQHPEKNRTTADLVFLPGV